nr:MAG TPA: hypothetical protein [Caudoviricetes sp.]
MLVSESPFRNAGTCLFSGYKSKGKNLKHQIISPFFFSLNSF